MLIFNGGFFNVLSRASIKDPESRQKNARDHEK